MNTTALKNFWKSRFTLKIPTHHYPSELAHQLFCAVEHERVSFDIFKQETAKLGLGIRLSKRHRKSQTRRFYNVKPHSPLTTGNGESTARIDGYLKDQEQRAFTAKFQAAVRANIPPVSSARKRFQLMKTSGLYKKFPEHHFSKFLGWLESTAGGEKADAKEIVSEVNRFLYFCQQGEKVHWESLLDLRLVNNYLIVTQDKGVGPDGTKTKLERFTIALRYFRKFVLRDFSMAEKARTAEEELKEWIAPLKKKKRVIRMQNSWREELFNTRLIMKDVQEAISEEDIVQFRTALDKAMKKVKLSPKEYRKIIDTIFAWVTTQTSAVRAGAFQCMTIEELRNPMPYIDDEGEIFNIVFVFRHKTFSTHGPIAVPFDAHAWTAVSNYVRYVRPTVLKDANEELVFLNAAGNPIDRAGKGISKFSKPDKHITVRKIRHATATSGNEVLSDIERRSVARAIGHTMQVHEKTYTKTTLQNAGRAIEAQKKIRQQPAKRLKLA